MKLSNHSAVAIRAAALVLLLGAASPLAGQTTESPSGKMLTQAGVDSIVDSIGAVWTLGPRDPLIDGGVYPTKARNGVIDGSAAVLCYSGRSVNARGDLADGWWKWTDNALPTKGSWSLVSTTPIGCVVAPAAESPSGKMLTQAGVDSIVDSIGAVWTLGPRDPLIDGGVYPTKARNGVIDGSAAVLCYSGRSVNARGDLADGWWKWTDNALPTKGSWSLVSTTPIGCVVAPAAESPSGKMLTQAGVDSIVDSIGAVWTLGPRDPLIDGGVYPTKARNGVIDGSAAVLCYSGRSVNARGDLADGWWKWTDNALPTKGSWSLVSTTPIGCVVAPAAESPSGKMLTQAGVDSIVDSIGAVWTLGPRDPLIDGGVYPTKARNGVIDGSAAVLCYSGRSVNARGDLADGWWKWTDDATLLLEGSWSLVSTTPIGCVVAPAADTTPPTVPTGLVAVAISPTQIRLTWNPSTDNVGVTGYLVYNADTGSTIATTTTTSLTHSGLVPGTTHNYRVSAFDAVPNHSPWTDPPVSVTTLPPDTTAPSTPTELFASAVSSSQINLSWTASTDNVKVTRYIVRRDGVKVATPAATSYADAGLSAATTYSYTVAARDAAGNISPDSTSVSVTTASAADTTLPTTPTGLTAAAAGSTGANLSWSASTDNVGVTGYVVRRNGVQVATPAATSYADAGLSAATTYSYTVAARDAAGNISPDSASVNVTTASAADTTPPTTPTGLTAAAAGSTGANLSWSASTDNVGVTGYVVRRNGVQIATPATTSFANTGLSAATTYSYTVAARDAAGNISPDSASVNVTTASAADMTPPTTPTGLSAAVAGSTGANLSWSASTDNVGVTGYVVRRNGVQ